MQKMTSRHYMVIVAFSLAIAASIGLLVNIGGLFFTPMAKELNVGRGSVSLTMTICNLVAALGGTLMPKVIRKETFKPVVLAAALVTAVCTALLSIADRLWLIYVLNAVRGFATGFIGSVAGSMVLNNWFYLNTGLVTSIALGFSGIAGALFSPLFSGIIANVGWRTSYLIVGIVMFVFYLPLILFPIGMRPEDVGTRAYGDKIPDKNDAPAVSEVSSAAVSEASSATVSEVSSKTISEGSSKAVSEVSSPARPETSGRAVKQTDSSTALKTRTAPAAKAKTAASVPAAMFIFAACYAACGGSLTTVVQHFPGVADTYALPAAIGAGMMSASMITNTSGKLLIGFLIDKIGIKISALLYLCLVAVGAVLLLTGPTGTTAVIAAALIGLGYSLSTVGVVMLVRTAFGMANYSRVYPKVALFTTAFYALGTTFVGVIYDHTGSYTLVFILQLAALAIMGTMMMLLMGRKKG